MFRNWRGRVSDTRQNAQNALNNINRRAVGQAYVVSYSKVRPGSDAVLFMSRTNFEFGLTQINKSTSVDSDVELN